jgi:hypothetical protein
MGEDTGKYNALVLTDQQGNYYAIPREVLESHRVTGEQKAQIEEAMGGDVEGFRWAANRSATAGPQTAGADIAGPQAVGPQAARATMGGDVAGPRLDASVSGPTLLGSFIFLPDLAGPNKY